MRYIKYFSLFLLLGLLYISCEKKDDSVYDPRLNFPKLSDAYVTPNTFDTIYISNIIGVKVLSEEAINKVTAKILNPNNILLAEIELKDNGIAPDTTAQNGWYTASFNQLLDCKLIGSYKIEIIAENISGLIGNTVVTSFTVTNVNNHQPGISNLIAPDSLRRPSGVGADTVNIAFLQVSASDPDGICDVNEAKFNSFKPDGIPSSGNPFTMFDDGNIIAHGDTTAFDGKFSLLIQINSSNQIGNYLFKFNTKDIGGLVSDTTFKTITVHP